MAIARYHANALTTAQVLEELIALAKDIRAARARGEETGLSENEIAFYDALAANESAKSAMGGSDVTSDRSRASDECERQCHRRLDAARGCAGTDAGAGKAHPEETRVPTGPTGCSGVERVAAG